MQMIYIQLSIKAGFSNALSYSHVTLDVRHNNLKCSLNIPNYDNFY